ncbi:hypothetical protein I4U23_022111 [Adineta vaga]|nr:hypothetical protein I4U23_022111 [Adineta vaga]
MSNLQEEDECISPDYMPIHLSFIDPSPPHSLNLMEDLRADEELSDNRISELMQQFLSEFTEQYPTSGPPLYMGSIDQALLHSLYNYNNVQPLILFLYNGQSVHTNLLLEMVQKHLGDQIKQTIASASSHTVKFSILICLAYNNGRIEITNTIHDCVSPHDTLVSLKEARDRFDSRIETPHSANLLWIPTTNEVWSMASSVSQPVEESSEEFERVSQRYARQREDVIEIHEVENSSWSSQYRDHKEVIHNLRHDDQIEKILVYPCSQVRALHILQHGFNNDH